MAFEVSSVPLSLTMVWGRPRRPTMPLSSRATRSPEIDVSATSGQALARAVVDDRQDAEAPPVDHLVRDEVEAPALVRLQRDLIGRRVPMARLRPPRRRTVSFSSR